MDFLFVPAKYNYSFGYQLNKAIVNQLEVDFIIIHLIINY